MANSEYTKILPAHYKPRTLTNNDWQMVCTHLDHIIGLLDAIDCTADAISISPGTPGIKAAALSADREVWSIKELLGFCDPGDTELRGEEASS